MKTLLRALILPKMVKGNIRNM